MQKISNTIEIEIPFFDVDSMEIVWHGNYVKYFEVARCALLDKIGYNYHTMKAEGYAWPIVQLHVKYIKPCVFRQKIKIVTTLIEYENCIKITYLTHDVLTDQLLNKAESMQMAIDMKTLSSCFESPTGLISRVQEYQKKYATK